MDAGCRQRSCRTGFHGAAGYARSAGELVVLTGTMVTGSFADRQMAMRPASNDICDICEVGA
jgi:hypothetical protein